MTQGRRPWRSLLALLALAGLVGGAPARAQNLDINQAGALLVLAVITGGYPGNPIQGTSGDVIVPNDRAETRAKIWSGSGEPRILLIDVISGDPPPQGDGWSSTSFQCGIEERGTVELTFLPSGDGATVSGECAAVGNVQGGFRSWFVQAANGIAVVAVANEEGVVVSEDVLVGGVTIVDDIAEEAFSLAAIPFQAGTGQNDGNKVYHFDGLEYERFPSVLATNFLAPTADVDAELILFTLDGTVGSPPRVKIGGFAYDDDEQYFDWTYQFDCFDIVALEELDVNFAYTGGASGLGSIAGHLEIVTQPVANGLDVHDAAYGDANFTRRRGVHGWIVQEADGVFLPGGQPTPRTGMFATGGDARWGRTLAQSGTGLLPFGRDKDTTLDAQVR